MTRTVGTPPPLVTDVVRDGDGSPMAGVTVTVSGTVYSNQELTAVLTPVVTDGAGVFSFYAPAGVYTFTVPAGVAPVEPVQVLGTVTAAGVAVDMSAVVAKSLFDANTVLKADVDNTPAALPMGASTTLARLASGGIKAASVTEMAALYAGTSGTSLAVGNDSRLSDARTPTAHKTSHATGGSDALVAADVGAVAATVPTWASGQDVVAGVSLRRGTAPYFGVWVAVTTHTTSGSFDGWLTGKWAWVGGSGYGTAATRSGITATGGPDGYRYTDTDTGVENEVRAGTWVALIQDFSGTVVAGPVEWLSTTGTFDLTGVGTTLVDISTAATPAAPVTMAVSVAASANRPVVVRADFDVLANPGTASLGAVYGPIFALQTTVPVNLDCSTVKFLSSGVAGTQATRVSLFGVIPAPVAAQTVKAMVRMSAATKPTNWTNCTITPGGATLTTPNRLVVLAG